MLSDYLSAAFILSGGIGCIIYCLYIAIKHKRKRKGYLLWAAFFILLTMFCIYVLGSALAIKRKGNANETSQISMVCSQTQILCIQRM